MATGRQGADRDATDASIIRRPFNNELIAANIITVTVMQEGSLSFGKDSIGIHLMNENYGKFFRKLFEELGVTGKCLIDLDYGEGFTQATICRPKSPRLFFKKLGVKIGKNFKGTFDSMDIDMVISNLVEKYGWQDCRIECKDLFIEQNHDEYFIVRQKPGKALEWRKISKAIETVLNSL